MGLECDMSRVIARFEEMERKAKNDLVKKALDKGSDIILKSLERNVPEDTGDLKSSLDKGKLKLGANASIEIGSQSNDEDIIRYAYYQEYGTENMLGKKWMKRSWNDSISDASEAIKKSIIEDLLE